MSDAERVRLSQAGVNTLLVVRSTCAHGLRPAHARRRGVRRLGLEYLSARRLALFVAASIEQGTRWVLLEHNGPATWERARAWPRRSSKRSPRRAPSPALRRDESHFVIGDERVNGAQTVAEGKFNLLFGFATSKPGEFDTWLVTHRAGASRVRPVSVNRSATSQAAGRVGDQTSILRGAMRGCHSGGRLGNSVPEPPSVSVRASQRVVSVSGGPKPPPPGVRMVSSSPGCTSKRAVAPASRRSPAARRMCASPARRAARRRGRRARCAGD